MPIGGGEHLERHPGLGQIVADKIETRLNTLATIYPVLRDRTDFKLGKEEIRELAMNPAAALEEVEALYNERIVPMLLTLQDELARGLADFKGGKRVSARIEDPKAFAEIQAMSIGEVEGELQADVQDSAVDSVIAGDIRISDIFLPYQKEIRERTLYHLIDTYCSGEQEEGEQGPTDIADIEALGAELFEVLSADDSAILEKVEAGELSRQIAEIISEARKNIQTNFGLSTLPKKTRFKLIRRAHLGRVEEDEESPEESPRSSAKELAEIMDRLRVGDVVGFKGSEEKALRMRHGIPVDRSVPLDYSLRTANSEAAARIRLIEQHALAGMGIIPQKTPTPPPESPAKPTPPGTKKRPFQIVRDD